jgi:hypothetical protein
MFSVRNEGPLPLRVEGIIGELGDVMVAAVPWRAVWIPPGPNWQEIGFLKDAKPFTPTVVGPGEELQLYLVGRAGPCAYGATYQVGADVAGHAQLGTTVDVVVNVLGLSTSTPIDLPMLLAEPIRNGCSG